MNSHILHVLLTHSVLSCRTLHKVYSFVAAQQEKNKFKIILRSSEMKTLLRDCTAEFERALETFKVQISPMTSDFRGSVFFSQIQGANLLADAKAFEEYARQTDQEILELIADETSSNASSVCNPLWIGFSLTIQSATVF